MADYTHYGAESPDWAEYMRLHPPAALPKDLSPSQLQHITNEGREANSREILESLTCK